ncbi:MAG: HAD family hydrolase [Lachnospiraceae bacterium]|nr:HAD family hydrolase [Lachnospiraceae bacterium]
MAKKRYILLDLDGTLLPVHRSEYEAAFLPELQRLFQEQFPDCWERIDAALKAAFENGGSKPDGKQRNEERFRKIFHEKIGALTDEVMKALDAYYGGDYHRLSSLVHPNGIAEKILNIIEENDAVPVLATNPVSPASCIYERIRWAGVKPEQFYLVTVSENSCFVKPDRRYYEELLGKIDASPEECLMIGNDTDEDMEGALQAGIETYLVTDYVVDRRNSIEQYRHGNYQELLRDLAYMIQGVAEYEK